MAKVNKIQVENLEISVLLVDSSEEEPRLLHNVMSNKIALEFATTSRGLTG